MKLTKEPLLRLYHLTIAAKDKQKFEDEGVRNMTTSIKKEPGTLFMTATHEDEAGTSNYVLECYQDSAHYQIHAASPQFKHYGSVAQKVLTGRKMFTLKPQLVLTKPEKLLLTGQNDYYLRLIELKLAEGKLSSFKAALAKEMGTDITKEKGVKAVLGGNLADFQNEWRILEAYQNKAAFASHQQTEWFKQFTAAAKETIIKADVIELTVDTLVDQGQLIYQ